ncbi:hypothetical protein [Actinopolyspora mortivallis]|uniref:hypothetical protein n=1 Tax=Actinopolyspora mortivallis TaxID=33906 RepID=UPI0003744F77|nr:hypothetical protein [Actinopolyspora mortivallis]
MVLGRAKFGRRQRAENAEDADTRQRDETDGDLESYLAALSPEEDPETTGTGRSFGNSEVHQLRLPLMANERLKELAAEQGTSPSALARDWVLQHLNDLDERPEPRRRDTAQPEQDESPAPGSAGFPEDSGTPQWPSEEGFPTEFPEATEPQDGYQPRAFPQAPGGWAAAPEETDTEITIPHGQYRY